MTPAADDRRRRRVVLVAAVADNGVIGREGDVPWHLPGDLAHFRAVTRGHTVVMGRRTFEAIGHPLPYRTNVVVTRSPDWAHEGVLTAPGLRDAIALAQGFDGDVMIIGGAQIYAQALPLADAQILTEVHQSPAGDAYYPQFDRSRWREARRETRDGYDLVWWERAGIEDPGS